MPLFGHAMTDSAVVTVRTLRGKYAAAEKAGTLDTLPANHAPDFAPLIDPTLRTGVEAMITVAGVWLGASPLS